MQQKGKKKFAAKDDLTTPDEPFKNPLFNPDLLPDADLNTYLLTNSNLCLQGNCVPNVKTMQTIIDRKDGRGQKHQLKAFLETHGHRLPEGTPFVKLTKGKENRYLALECRHIAPREEAEMHCLRPITMLPRAMQLKARTIVLVAYFIKLDCD